MNHRVTNFIKAATLFLLITSILLPMTATSEEKGKAPEMSFDGLTLTKETKTTQVYLATDIDWSIYTSVQVMDPQVSFIKNWKRHQNANTYDTLNRVTDKDMQRIKSTVASMLKETFEQKFTQHRFSLTDEINDNTLLLKPAIINLNVTAADTMSASRSRTYVKSAGSAILYLEVYDATSGQIVARILDYREAPERGSYNWASRASNRAEAQRIINFWADRLVKGLDSLQAGK